MCTLPKPHTQESQRLLGTKIHCLLCTNVLALGKCRTMCNHWVLDTISLVMVQVPWLAMCVQHHSDTFNSCGSSPGMGKAVASSCRGQWATGNTCRCTIATVAAAATAARAAGAAGTPGASGAWNLLANNTRPNHTIHKWLHMSTVGTGTAPASVPASASGPRARATAA
jgi:hypothetical protein